MPAETGKGLEGIVQVFRKVRGVQGQELLLVVAVNENLSGSRRPNQYSVRMACSRSVRTVLVSSHIAHRARS
jgi:hypothetical protein